MFASNVLQAVINSVFSYLDIREVVRKTYNAFNVVYAIGCN